MTDSTVMADGTTETVNLDYDGRTSQFAGVVIVNLILQVLTLGIYRFWARTRERRFLWSHVSLGGDRLEYTGTGSELFVGFLIAMVIMIPLGAVYTGLLTMFGSDPVMMGVVIVPYMLVIMFLVYVATYRARRYRLTRTLWRGIRGTLMGSSLRYAVAAMGYYVVTLITAGLAAPFMRVGLMRREIENMHFGNRPFAFDGKAREMLARWIVPWLSLLVLIIGYAWYMYLIFGVMDASGIDPYDPDAATPDPATMDNEGVMGAAGQLPMAGALIGIGGLLYVVSAGWYRVWEFRYLAGKVSFEGIRFSSSLGFGRVVWIYISYFLVAIFLTLVIAVVAMVLSFIASGFPMDPELIDYWFETNAAEMDPDLVGTVAVVVTFFLMFVFQVLGRILVFHRLARAVVASLTLTGAQDFSQVAQALDTAPRAGEGLADAFDLGDF